MVHKIFQIAMKKLYSFRVALCNLGALQIEYHSRYTHYRKEKMITKIMSKLFVPLAIRIL